MIEKHRPWPMEWDPDRATMSSTERLNLANSLIREVALDLGLGIMSLESSWLAVKLSSLPNFTSQSGPPLKATASLAAMTMISAQETTPGHASSSANLISSTTSNDLNEFILDRASFSPTIVGVSSNKTDPSHPLTKQSWNCNLITDAPLRASLFMAFFITSLTIDSASGQLDE
uniref:Uncharacterized protein n=1 Tax=Opuntia streptacantha TaxID=393608 RepID=A0A7C8ZLU4_OPUST